MVLVRWRATLAPVLGIALVVDGGWSCLRGLARGNRSHQREHGVMPAIFSSCAKVPRPIRQPGQPGTVSDLRYFEEIAPQ